MTHEAPRPPIAAAVLESPYSRRWLWGDEGWRAEVVPGIRLGDRLGASPPPSWAEGLRYALQICQALREAESKGLAHGSLSTEAIALEALERHCCEAERYRAKLEFPQDPPSASPEALARDAQALGALLERLIPGLSSLSSLTRATAALLRGDVGARDAWVLAAEAVVQAMTFRPPTPAQRLAAAAIDAIPVIVFFSADFAIGLAVWFAADILGRWATASATGAGQSLGERLLDQPPAQGWPFRLIRAALYAAIHGGVLFIRNLMT